MSTVRHVTRFAHRARSGPAALAVVHGTGATDLAKIIDYYVGHAEGVAPHYVIDYDGTRLQFVDEDRIAHHVGYGPEERDLYRAGWDTWSRRIKKAPWRVDAPFAGYASWRARWPAAASPADLVGAELAVNSISIGIELRSPRRRQAAIYYAPQYAELAVLLRELGARHGFPLTRAKVLGHYDCNPISRATVRGDYDPGEAFDWPGLLAAVA